MHTIKVAKIGVIVIASLLLLNCTPAVDIGKSTPNSREPHPKALELLTGKAREACEKQKLACKEFKSTVVYRNIGTELDAASRANGIEESGYLTIFFIFRSSEKEEWANGRLNSSYRIDKSGQITVDPLPLQLF